MKQLYILCILIDIVFSQIKYDIRDFSDKDSVLIVNTRTSKYQKMEKIDKIAIEEFVRIANNNIFYLRTYYGKPIQIVLPIRKNIEERITIEYSISYMKDFYETDSFIKYFIENNYDNYYITSTSKEEIFIISDKLYNEDDEVICLQVHDNSIRIEIEKKLGLEKRCTDETGERPDNFYNINKKKGVALIDTKY